MSTHGDLLPEPHSRTSKRSAKDRQRRTFYIEDLARSDPHKVPRGLFERNQNSQRATTRVIRHSQSHETVVGFSHFFVEVCKGRAAGLSTFLVQVYNVLRLPRKMSPRQTAAQTLCELAQAKRTWTSKVSFYARIYSKNLCENLWTGWSTLI